MPVSVSLADLSFNAPDGSAVLTRLTLVFGPHRTGLVGRNGAGKSTLLRLIAGELRPSGGRIEAPGAIGVLRQAIAPQPGAILADLFAAREGLDRLARAGTGQAGARELAAADWTLPARIAAALARAGLHADPRRPLAALSGGERTRAGLAALIFAEPDLLLLDEPTNNLDAEGRRAVADLLEAWRGAAIVASHDRALLERMDAIVELGPEGARIYGGGFSRYAARRAEERAAAARALADAERAEGATRRRAQEAAERKARRDGRGKRQRAKGGQAKALLDFAKERAQASGGANARLREARQAAAGASLAAARDHLEVIAPVRMEIAPTGLAAGRTVLRLDGVSAGYQDGPPIIRDLSLALVGPGRLAVLGPNGSGKTTFLRVVTGQIAPRAGRVDLAVPHALLDQDLVTLDPVLPLREVFARQSPAADDRTVRAVLARFGFRAGDALRAVGTLSGGERLRAGLACALGRVPVPMLLILDEPTNHLDLDGIAALESALDAYDGAVIAVSHDAAFLERLGPDRRLVLGR